MLTLVEFEPEREYSPHSHEEVQIGYVLQGEAEIMIKDKEKEETVILKESDFIGFKPNLIHGAKIRGEKN